MKINLEYGKNILNGYINISAWPPQELPKDLPEDTKIIVGQAGNLDQVIENNTCDEILFNPLFNLIRPNDVLGILQHWQKKLKTGGILKLSFVDIRLLSRYIYNGEMNLQDIHNTIIGQDKQYQSVIDTDVMKNALSALGFKIESIDHKQFFVAIEAIK